MIRTFLLVLLFVAVGAMPIRIAVAVEDSPTFEQLRKNYTEARDELAKIERPEIGSDGFREKIRVWSSAVRVKREAAHALVVPLIQKWTTLSIDSDEFAALRDELNQMHKEHTGKLNEASRKERSFFANSIYPHVIDKEMSKEHAAILADLSKPHLSVRMNDKIAESGQPTEPSNWNVQDTYSLALLRAGKFEEARRENALLLQKTKMNIARARLPNGKINYRGGKRTTRSLRREYLLHGALIDAVAGESEKAKEMLNEATAIEEVDAIANQQQRVVKEVESRL